MLRIFQSSNPLTLLLLILYAVLVNLKWLIYPAPAELHTYSYISNIIFNKWLQLPQLPVYIVLILHIAIIVVTGILICFLMQQFKIITKPSLIPAAIFITICSIFPAILFSSPEILCGILLVWILFKTFSIYNKTKADMAYFDVGLMSSLMSLLYFPAIVFCFFGIITLFRMRSTSFRDFFIYMVGIVLGYFLIGTVVFWFDLLPEFAKAQFVLPKGILISEISFSVITIVKLSIIGIIFITALIFLSNKFSVNLIQVRKYLGAFVWLFVFAIASCFLNYPLQEYALFPVLLAVSLFISYYFYHSKNRLAAELMFLTLIGTTLIFQYINFAS